MQSFMRVGMIMTNQFNRGFGVLVGLALLCAGCVTPEAPRFAETPDASAGVNPATLADDARFDKFKPYAEQSRYTIDHTPWARFLNAAVFDIGPSSRRRAPRGSGGVYTGTRISTASKSRVRFEGNRVMFHLFKDGTMEFISAYREEMAGVMDDYNYAEFGRDEQLAFWLNLHNAILIHEIAKVHPISRPGNYRLRSHDNALLFDAKLVQVAGEPLSLNDIRHKIVFANWSEPQVLYGFWDGAIGGADVMTNAFTGANVWTLLRSNANHYVNSLRAIEAYPGSFGRTSFRVSKVFFEARRLFPEWPISLYAHMDSHAGNAVGRLLADPPRLLRVLPYDASTADFSGGEVARFGGNDNIAAILTLQDDDQPSNQEGGSAGTASTVLENFGAPVLNQTMRGGVSADSLRLRDIEIENRQRRERDVTIEDVESPDPGVDEGEAGESEN